MNPNVKATSPTGPLLSSLSCVRRETSCSEGNIGGHWKTLTGKISFPVSLVNADQHIYYYAIVIRFGHFEDNGCRAANEMADIQYTFFLFSFFFTTDSHTLLSLNQKVRDLELKSETKSV